MVYRLTISKIMAQNIITADEFLTLAKGLQEIQNKGIRYKSLTIQTYFSKYKVEKRLGGDGNSHPSIEIKIFFSNVRNFVSYAFYDWNKKETVLNNLNLFEDDMKKYKDIVKIIDKMKEDLL